MSAAWRSCAALAKAREARTRISRERQEEFARLLGVGYTAKQAAWQLHISERHAYRYQAALRDRTKKEGQLT